MRVSHRLGILVLAVLLGMGLGSPSAWATPIDPLVTDHTFEDHSNDDHRNEDLGGLDFSFGTFANTDLRGTDFVGTILENVDFSNADLRGNGDFSGAFFGGANLTGIVTNGATSLTGAFYTPTTIFGPGFDPVAEGMVLVPEPRAALLLGGGLLALGARRRPRAA